MQQISCLLNLNCRYVPDPVKILGELKSRRERIETVAGEIVAGDAVDLDVISMKSNN